MPQKPKTDSEQRSFRRAAGIVGSWIENLGNERQAISGIENTAWAALNAVTEWADHDRTIRRGDASVSVQDARLHSNILGSSAVFKTDALEIALELCK